MTGAGPRDPNFAATTGVAFVAGESGAMWRVERLEHPHLPLWIACEGERLAVVSMRTREIVEAHAQRCGARLGSAPPTPSRASGQLREYLEGARLRFELELIVDPEASAFELEAWAALCRIPFGETRSYGEQAQMLAKPGAARAVGRANSRNPMAVVIPCHRVIGADGKLTGFTGGLPNKRWLLAHEGVRLPAEAGPALPVPDTQLGFGF